MKRPTAADETRPDLEHDDVELEDGADLEELEDDDLEEDDSDEDLEDGDLEDGGLEDDEDDTEDSGTAGATKVRSRKRADSTGSGTGSRTDVVGTDARTMRVAVGFLVLAVLLGGLATFFALQSGGSADGNTALADVDATRTVNQEIGNDLNTVMSFDYKDPGKTTRAAKELFADPKLAGDYSKVMNVLQSKGGALKLSVDTKVVTSGVERLEGDNAVVLALATQTYTKGDNAQQGQAVAIFRVNAVNDDGRWRISKLEQY